LLPHHEHELIRRIEKLFNVGETVIEGWEMRLWYTQDDPTNQMYIDVQKRYDVMFAAFFGDSEDSHLTLLRQNDKTLFLNSELLVRLDVLIDDTPSEVTVWEQPAPVKHSQ
jgi:hypothetical protein